MGNGPSRVGKNTIKTDYLNYYPMRNSIRNLLKYSLLFLNMVKNDII
jgi:hypothetical protein